VTPAVAAWVEATRSRQGLPGRVEDEQVLDEIATIVIGGQVERGDGGRPA
jgi:hypothetical protein